MKFHHIIFPKIYPSFITLNEVAFTFEDLRSISYRLPQPHLIAILLNPHTPSLFISLKFPTMICFEMDSLSGA